MQEAHDAAILSKTYREIAERGICIVKRSKVSMQVEPNWHKGFSHSKVSIAGYEQLVQDECLRLSQADHKAAKQYEAGQAERQQKRARLTELEDKLIKDGSLPPHAASHRRQYDHKYDQNAQRPSLWAALSSSAGDATRTWEQDQIQWPSQTLTAQVYIPLENKCLPPAQCLYMQHRCPHVCAMYDFVMVQHSLMMQLRHADFCTFVKGPLFHP